MAGKRDGVPTIIHMAREIAKLVNTYGAATLESKTSPQFKLAIEALIVAVRLFESLDDHPAEVDNTLPLGVEDLHV
jgi:hypothetical protein